jgi:putative transposon-encoded protein
VFGGLQAQNGDTENMNEVDLEFEKKLERYGNDTVVRCPKCGRTQYLRFENGLKNGWDKCCGGFTMPIVYVSNMPKTVHEAMKKVIAERVRV